MTMTLLDSLQELTETLTTWLSVRSLDDTLEAALMSEFGPNSYWFNQVETLARQGMVSGEFGNREGGGIRFGRLIKPSEATAGFSLDMVLMNDRSGPHHRHPNGEVDLVIPLAPQAQFDGTGRGWKVYPPESAHSPTVIGGPAIVLYFLPNGAIEFD